MQESVQQTLRRVPSTRLAAVVLCVLAADPAASTYCPKCLDGHDHGCHLGNAHGE
jgi:hypothetical protein